jgi:hypothetical protein
MAPVKVDGNVDTQNCRDLTDGKSVTLFNAQIAGNFDCSNNSGGCEIVGISSVKGNVLISNNGGSFLTSLVEGVTIGGNLQCFGNASITVGSNNVGGHTQCVTSP